ncbi:hypothetical protein MACH07_10060 [Flagellimonas marinaquae]|uniref:Uncharacterized protein n=1 Tax=Flagellimonas marinaquae TaxID=254955 RepID=A0AA48HMC3_9FLAO|nr:hypothetical protein MACH07_10060 [Allomuricauda aquimarina]
MKINYIYLPEFKNPNLNQNEELPFRLWGPAGTPFVFFSTSIFATGKLIFGLGANL